MNRRHFLICATGVLAVNQPLLANIRTTAVDPATLAAPELLSFLGDRDFITTLGQCYLQQFPDEASIATLSASISDKTGTSSKRHRPEQIARQVAHEFANDETVLLNGWMLSRTEARQAALFSLLHSRV
jgi:hypothetical protein